MATSEKVKELTTDTFESVVLKSSTPVLVDFWAPWCGPCKMLAPILEEIASEMADRIQIAKVDVEENTDVAAQYQVNRLPTMLFFKDGKVVDQIIGWSSKPELSARLEALI
ncbi:thioredoxin [Cerasicoccus arenae]|uniref:Thioredoxin n=1 Tax=Cerasicoccus arenae TaxID=424488 RepID=A0A8J3DHA1_9BACT|nr:thioredoxin [Cerasicoccus arenae]MBK1857220.1 thioredoxin [Cerasicoccus arenae]GHC00080.1 thiol reductase thioredoxin [Cerasicoccus arenae]